MPLFEARGGPIGQKVADVGWSQGPNLGDLACQRPADSATVRAGRLKPTFFARRGRGIATAVLTPPQEYRSRGCRRARTLFWRWQWSVLWPLAQRKKSLLFMWTNPFRSNRPTPASTSNQTGRARPVNRPAPARFRAAGSFHKMGACSNRRSISIGLQHMAVKPSRRDCASCDRSSFVWGIECNSEHRQLRPASWGWLWHPARQSPNLSPRKLSRKNTARPSSTQADRPQFRSAPILPKVCRFAKSGVPLEPYRTPIPLPRPGDGRIACRSRSEERRVGKECW